MYNHHNWKPVHMTRFQLNREKNNMVANPSRRRLTKQNKAQEVQQGLLGKEGI